MQGEDPKIIGLTKVRNEQAIINDTLDRWGEICTGGIVVYDDVSDDNTVQICREHKSVETVIEGKIWDSDREKAEWMNRQAALNRGKQMADEDTWFVYFDADEHLYDFNDWGLFKNPDVNAIACRLFDFYITPEDKEWPYHKRQWIGPEYRTITFFFRNLPNIKYHQPDQRIVTLPDGIGNVPIHGDVKHYGKGFSVDEWEETCDYYIKFFPKYSDKWRQRKGKAVHEDMKSDFGHDLIKWNERDKHQLISLERQTYGLN